MSRICVYTAIFGGYDELRPHVEIPGVDWFAFTDEPTLTPDWRQILVVTTRQADPRLLAKRYKVLPSSLEQLDSYDFTIWIDGSHEVISPSFVDEALADLGPDGFALHRNPHRDCIYSESAASVGLPKYEGQPIREQVVHYAAEGHPANAGLYATGSMARARSAKLNEAMLAWWAEIERWTIQDQLSLPVVCRRFGLEPHVWPYNQIAGYPVTRWFRFHPHADGTT